MRITVCELPDEAARRDAAWAELVRHLRAHPTDVVVLPDAQSRNTLICGMPPSGGASHLNSSLPP